METDNRRGILLMLLAMAAFACEDAVIKAMSGPWSTAQILLTIGGGGAVVFGVLARRAGQPILDPRLRHPAVAIRCVAEFAGTFLFVTALATAPLGIASAILQVAPVALVAAGALLLGEKVGPRRWAAVLTGFAGVLLIVEPWSEGFEPALVLAVAAALALAIRDLATRLAPAGIGTLTLSAWGYLMILPAALLSLAIDPRLTAPTAADLPAIVALIALGVLGYYAVTAALRAGEISAVAPFRYTRLVFAGLLGMAVFGERPGPVALVGVGLIVAAGLYAMMRERRLAARIAGSGGVPR